MDRPLAVNSKALITTTTAPPPLLPASAKVDGAAAVAKLPGTSPLEHAACRLVEAGREPAKLGREGGFAAAHLAQITRPHDDALGRVLPVHPQDGDGGVIVKPGAKIGLGDAAEDSAPSTSRFETLKPS